MKKQTHKNGTRAYVGDTVNNNRNNGDFYATPEKCTEDLLKREKFVGSIWECACGEGAISKVLIKNGYDVYSSDLIDRGYGDVGVDFLKQRDVCSNIITNPPFKLSMQFCLQSLKMTKHKIAFFNKLTFLEGVKRQSIFEQGYLKNIYVYARRINLKKYTYAKRTGAMAFAWFVFDKSYQGKPMLDWI